MNNKILCVGNWDSDVGYAWWLMERFWEGIARKYPGQVTISFKKLTKVSDRLANCGAEFIEADFASPDFVKVARGFDHIYLTDQPYISATYAKLKAVGVKSIIVHDHSPGDRTTVTGVKRLVKYSIARLPLITADAYIAVSDFVRERFDECGCLPQSKCFTAVNGIDLDLITPPADIRSELGIPKDAPLIVSSSRVTQYKRVDHIIRAAVKSPGYFVHCGDGPYMAECVALIAQLGLEKRFFMLGKRTDVLGIIAAADIGVHASKGEVGSSLSIMEFMRAGLPAVLPDEKSVSGFIQGSVSASFYRPGDIDHLSDKVRALASSESLRKRLGREAQLHVTRFSISTTVEDVLSVFKSLAIPIDRPATLTSGVRSARVLDVAHDGSNLPLPGKPL